jgi:hypothetical protein
VPEKTYSDTRDLIEDCPEILARRQAKCTGDDRGGDLLAGRPSQRLARARASGASWLAVAGSWQQASQILAEALGLWRSPALADVPSQLLQRNEVPRIDQLRLQAHEWRIDADLHLGRHAELVPELQSPAANPCLISSTGNTTSLPLFTRASAAIAAAFMRVNINRHLSHAVPYRRREI